MLTFVGVAAGLAALLTSLGIIWTKGIKPALGFLRKSHETIEELVSYGPRIEAIEVRTRQLAPNGGSHMRDDITELRRMLTEHIQQSDKTEAEIRNDLCLHNLHAQKMAAEQESRYMTKLVEIMSDQRTHHAEAKEHEANT